MVLAKPRELNRSAEALRKKASLNDVDDDHTDTKLQQMHDDNRTHNP